MRLFRYEMKKLLINNKKFIVLAVLFLFYAAAGFGNSYMSLGNSANYQTFKSLAVTATGQYDKTQAEVSNSAYQIVKDRYGAAEGIDQAAMADPQLYFDIEYHNYATAVSEYNKGAVDDKASAPYGIEPVKKVLNELEKSGNTGTYTYQKLNSQLQTSLNLGEPKFANTTLWDTLYGNWGGYMILILLFFPIAYFVAPVYTKEVSTGMDNIILSSKNGQKKIVLAKLAAASATSAAVALIYLTATFIGNFLPFMTIDGIDSAVRSMNAMVRAPFGFNIGQFALITIIWVIAISTVFGFTMSFISAKMKNPTAAFGIGIGLLLGNLILGALGTNVVAFILPMIEFGFLKIADVTTIFGDVTTFNLFGMVVPYWVATIAVVIILSIIFISLIFRSQKHRTVA